MFNNDPLFANASPTATSLVGGFYLTLLVIGVVVALVLTLRLTRREAAWTEGARALAARPLTWRDAGMVMLLVSLLLLITLACGTPLRAWGASDTSLMILESLLVDAVGIAGIATILFRRQLNLHDVFGLGIRTATLPDPACAPGPPALPLAVALRYGVIAYLAMIPMIVFASLVSQGVLSARGIPPTMQDVALLLTAEHSLGAQSYLVFLAIVLAPLFEETVFRGVLLPLIARRFGLGVAVVTTSILFSAIHFHLYSAAPLFVVAAAFSLAYVYTGSLWVPVVMHGLFNGVNLALLLVLKNY